MGGGHSLTPESLEVLALNEEKSHTIAELRDRKKNIYVKMLKRVLQESDKAKKSEVNLWMMPDSAVLTIVMFLAGEYKILISVSPYWYFKIKEVLDATFSSIESHFALTHSHLFIFKRSFLYSGKIAVSSKHGIRVDRIMVAEPLPILANHTVKLRYTYRTYTSHQNYKAEFKLDCIPKGNKAVWLHRDESRGNEDTKIYAYSQQIPLVCVGDNIEFAINWYNLQGLLRFETIQWQPPLIQDTRAIKKSHNLAPEYPPSYFEENEGISKKMYLYNVNRVCDVELGQTEWYDSKYYFKTENIYFYDHFLPFLRLIKSQFTGVDVNVSKHTYRAEKEGIVPNSMDLIGIGIEIHNKNGEITNELKRMGLLYDRHCSLHLKIGDTLVLYISKGG
ncbi:unnamed protein product [Blepharisma stoltei]|uniref:Uncharacterized protein n=1 Tax=Blepharisma stoltei TaxID=1481888 RepID=A0AAU9K0Y7_9CILI|nr:unnamed protein product [Blepharisma stoltei]